MAYRRHTHSQPLPELKAACTLNVTNVQAAFRSLSKFRSNFRQAAQRFRHRFRAVQPPQGSIGNVQAALKGAKCRHVRPRFGTVARKPPCQKRNPDAVPEQQAAVRQYRPCAVQEIRYAAVKFGKSVRTAACAEMRVGALPVGFRQRFAGGCVQALYGGKGQVGKFVQAGQDFGADAVSGAINKARRFRACGAFRKRRRSGLQAAGTRVRRLAVRLRRRAGFHGRAGWCRLRWRRIGRGG